MDTLVRTSCLSTGLQVGRPFSVVKGAQVLQSLLAALASQASPKLWTRETQVTNLSLQTLHNAVELPAGPIQGQAKGLDPVPDSRVLLHAAVSQQLPGLEACSRTDFSEGDTAELVQGTSFLFEGLTQVFARVLVEVHIDRVARTSVPQENLGHDAGGP